MEEFFIQDGKIWVVVAVVAAIFVGIMVYLVYLDRKLKRLENE
jgi:CcmD family protein